MLLQQGKLPVLREKKVKRRSNGKVLMVIILFFIIILVVLFINSPFSKINTIEIEGYYFLSEEEIGQALGLQLGDHFFATSSQVLEERLKQIVQIETAIVSKRFPGRIMVEVNEFDEVAYVLSQKGEQLAILTNGSEIGLGEHQLQYNKPLLTGWADDDPVKVKLSKALAVIPSIYMDDISEIKPLPSLSYPDRIKLYTRSYFEVITAVEYLGEKLSYLDEVILELKSRGIYSGVITMLLADTHAPFEEVEVEQDDEMLNDLLID